VIASQADDLVRRPFLEVDQEVDDASTIRPPVDVVAKENELGPLRPCVALAKLNKTLELIQTSMDVANGIGVAQADARMVTILPLSRTHVRDGRGSDSARNITG